MAEQLHLANGREDSKDPESKRLPKEFSVGRHLPDTCTVPCKCKLTVPRSSIRETRFSILDSRKLRGSRLESSFETFESFREFFETIFETLEWRKQRSFRVINFSRVYFLRLLFYLTVGFHHFSRSSETLARHVSVFIELFCVLLKKKKGVYPAL